MSSKMRLYDAQVADILRCSQRDELFVNGVEERLQNFCKVAGVRSFYRNRHTIPAIANTWYYLMTSLCNLQTLGEEYTGIIRVRNNTIPSKLAQTIWLILYVGGDSLLDRFLNSLKAKVVTSKTLSVDAKALFTKTIDGLKEHKPTLKRIHHAIFYTNGKFYNVSNRMLNIRYVLVRQWMQDDSFTGSFNLLGNISLFYIFYNFIQQLWFSHNSGDVSETTALNWNITSRNCALCGDNIKAPSATPCGHIFCWNCIYESLEYQKNCPICRNDVKPSRIVFLQNFA